MDQGKGVRRGSRAKPASEKQSRTILASFTPREFEEVRRAAAKQPLATFVRELTLRHVARRRAQRARRKREGESRWPVKS